MSMSLNKGQWYIICNIEIHIDEWVQLPNLFKSSWINVSSGFISNLACLVQTTV